MKWCTGLALLHLLALLPSLHPRLPGPRVRLGRPLKVQMQVSQPDVLIPQTLPPSFGRLCPPYIAVDSCVAARVCWCSAASACSLHSSQVMHGIPGASQHVVLGSGGTSTRPGPEPRCGLLLDEGGRSGGSRRPQFAAHAPRTCWPANTGVWSRCNGTGHGAFTPARIMPS